MKVNELRIGNAILSDGLRTLVDRAVLIDFNNPLYTFEPIPLAEEILLKCGAKNLGYTDEFEDIKEYDLGLGVSIEWHININECSVFYYNSCVSYYDDNEIKLHQLQNLYFALTGKELEVNL